jgi:predicted nucleic acid-binding protein
VGTVVLDTDVASLIFRRRLPPTMRARLAGTSWCLTFATIGEMTQWAKLRGWAPNNEAGLLDWMSGLALLDSGWETARTWGALSADGRRRGRVHPINDTWIAACCLTEGLPLATLNVKDFADFADHNGLVLIGDDRVG